ncbi:Serine/threonine protein kinase, partial [Giardia duodenalis]
VLHTNSMETVWMLVNERIGIGNRDAQGMAALMHAVHNNHPEVVKIIAPTSMGRVTRIAGLLY